MDSQQLLKSLLAKGHLLTDDELAESFTHISSLFSERQALSDPEQNFQLVTGATMHERVLQLRELRASGQLEGLATGFTRTDLASGGLRPDELIVVGASSAVGKTNLVLNMFHNMAMAGVPTLFISLEMGNYQVYDRLIGLHTSPMIGGTEAQASELPVYYMPSEYGKPGLMYAFIKHFIENNPHIKCIAIDHLSLLPSLHTDRRLSHAAWVQKLREWVKEFRVPIILIHHLRRQAKDNDNPQLVDLAESQDIVNNADQIYLLQRDTESPTNRKYLHVMLKKNRNGGQLHRDVYEIDDHYKLSELDMRKVDQVMKDAKSIFEVEL
jgi:replicative DNA helicase